MTTDAEPSPLTDFQNASVGFLAGLSEVACQHPTVSWKNALQQRRPVPWSVRELYRGITPNALAVAPVTAIQFSTFGALTPHLDPLVAATISGGLSACVAAPLEKILVLQQLDRASLHETARRSLRSRPFKGFTLTAAREGCFAFGYLGLAPLLTSLVGGDFSDPAKRTMGSLAAGVIAGVTSHPFDTAKTFVQSSAEPISSAHALRVILNSDGISGLFRGLIPRGLRIVGAVVIIQEAKVRFENILFSSETSVTWSR